MACPWDSVPWARLGEEDEWRDLFAEVPRDVQSHRPWLLSAPSVCMNSQPRKREILSLRAGEEPMKISWSSPLVLQIIIMITPDGSNSPRAFTSGLAPMRTGAFGAGRTCVAEETESERGNEMGLRHMSGLGTGLQTHISLHSELITLSWSP